MPRGIPNKPRVQIETNDIGTNGPVETDFSSTVPESDLVGMSAVIGETLDSPILSAHIRELAFNEEPLDIIVANSTDKNAENPVSSGVNGVIKYFHRGVTYRGVARKFVASLIKREVNVATENYRDKQNLEQTKVIHTPAFKNNVQIVKDPSPLATEWFEWMQKSA